MPIYINRTNAGKNQMPRAGFEPTTPRSHERCSELTSLMMNNMFEICHVTPKKAYLLSFFSRHYHKIMKLKCKARRCLSLFSCNCVSRMTNYVNFKLSKDVKNTGRTQYNTDHHEVIIRPFMQNHSSTMHFL